jgi:hypothetical protein
VACIHSQNLVCTYFACSSPLQKRTKSKLLHWKVQNSPALETLEQHDTRIAQKVEAKQAAKLQRLSTMASAFGRESVEELEAVRTSDVNLFLAQIRTPIEGLV